MIGFIGKKEYYLVWNNSVQSAKWKSNDWEESRYWAMQVLSALLKKSESKWLSLSLSCPTCPVASFHISSLPGRPVVEKTLFHMQQSSHCPLSSPPSIVQPLWTQFLNWVYLCWSFCLLLLLKTLILLFF